MTTLATDLYLLVAAYGLALSVSYAGLPVLGQGAFVAVGAFGTSQLASHEVPLGIAAITAIAIAAVAGCLVGFAAARLAGAQLALATWALAWLAYTALVVFPRLSGGAQGLTRATPAHLVSPLLGLGGALRAASAAVGALGGAGTAVLLGVVAPADYSPLLSLQLFVAVLVGGTATWFGPAIGVALLAALPSTADALASGLDVDPLRARAVLTAVLLVAAIASRAPVSRLLRQFGLTTVKTHAVASSGDLHHSARRAGDVLLQLRGVSSSYGAVRALDRVDLEL